MFSEFRQERILYDFIKAVPNGTRIFCYCATTKEVVPNGTFIIYLKS